MQLRKMTGVLAALGTVGMVLMACRGSGADLSCSKDKDCLESEICHSDKKVCVQLCTTTAECPATASKCESETLSDRPPVKICKCGTKCADAGIP